MELNQITADLNFLTSVIHSLSVDCKMFIISNDNKKEFGLDIKCSKPTIADNQKIGRLLMQVNVSVLQEDEELPPDKFSLEIEGVFSSSAKMTDEDFLQYLNINGGAALYSIARAKIEAVSSLTYAEGKITLPMVNIVQYFKERNLTET